MSETTQAPVDIAFEANAGSHLAHLGTLQRRPGHANVILLPCSEIVMHTLPERKKKFRTPSCDKQPSTTRAALCKPN